MFPTRRELISWGEVIQRSGSDRQCRLFGDPLHGAEDRCAQDREPRALRIRSLMGVRNGDLPGGDRGAIQEFYRRALPAAGTTFFRSFNPPQGEWI